MAKRFKGKVVWITGGGSGLGEAMAHQFAEEGAKVAVSGRRLERLEAVVEALTERGSDALAVQCDVTDEPSVEAAVAAVVSHYGQLDVAVANAGFGVGGLIKDLSADDWRRQFDVNVVGAAMTAKHTLEELRKTNGRLGLVGSVAGTIAFPGVGAYHASKYAVRALGQVLSMELAGSGVSCTLLQPGFVESEIGQVDNDGKYHEDWTDKRPRRFMWASDRAARTMVDALYRRKREFTFTGHGKLAAFLGKHSPGVVHHVAVRFGKGAYKR